MDLVPLIPIGSKIIVDKSKMNDNLSKKLFDELPEKINGEIIDYKMTDGMGIGYILLTESKSVIWVFDHELNNKTKELYKLKKEPYKENITLLTREYQTSSNVFDINGNKEISYVVNPINFIKWITFTLNDVF